jgi:hypothetical protein
MIFFVIVLAIALALFGLSLLAQANAAKKCDVARHWETATGQVVGSAVREVSNGYMPEVSYTYEVAGRGYASDRLRPGGTPMLNSQTKAAALAAAFPEGSTVAVRYDPARPDRPAIDLTPMSYWILPLRVFAGMALVCAILIPLLAHHR